MIRASIVGVGRVGGALARSLPSDRYSIANLVSRDVSSAGVIARELGSQAFVSSLNEDTKIESDVVFITTQDGNIVSAADQISSRITGTPTVFHTSGAFDSSVLSALKAMGCSTGSIHPLVSISSAELGPERFPGSFFCVEGDENAVAVGTRIVEDLSGRPFSIDTRFKTLYHAAAVTACGHLVALFDAAVEMMTKCGLSSDESKQILLPLVTSTVKNLNEQSTAAALTGTFARADTDTFTRHLTALNENVSDSLLEIYLLLGERSLELAARQGVSEERIDILRTKVSIAKSKLKW
ncbi:MAG: Rossmann-like and DUF2520 domain-containing protein [Pyrinomonadaceae bacterium]